MTGTSYKAIRCPCDIRGGEIPNIGSMDKRCALLPGSGEVFGNAYGWKPRPLLATGIVDAGARTIDKMKPAGKAKPGGLPRTKQRAFIFGVGISEYRSRVRSIDPIRTISRRLVIIRSGRAWTPPAFGCTTSTLIAH